MPQPAVVDQGHKENYRKAALGGGLGKGATV